MFNWGRFNAMMEQISQAKQYQVQQPKIQKPQSKFDAFIENAGPGLMKMMNANYDRSMQVSEMLNQPQNILPGGPSINPGLMGLAGLTSRY